MSIFLKKCNFYIDKVEDGMFSHEYLVEFKNKENKDICLFIHKSLVKRDLNGKYFIEIDCFTDKNNKKIGVLPNQPFNDSVFVQIPEEISKETMLLSEDVLSKDWNNEDKAWQNL